MVSGKNYPLTNGLAYESTVNDEEVIAVILSGQAVSIIHPIIRLARQRAVETIPGS